MITSDPFLSAVYSPKIISKLEQRFGPFHTQHVNLVISTDIMRQMVVKMNQKTIPRRAEVVMVVPNEQGQVWLHTKSFYPRGVYRLMTGGLEAGEAPHQALRREVAEETGFKVKAQRCLAVITYTVAAAEGQFPFVSYIFLTSPTQGQPQPTDPKEAITHFQAVPVSGLADTAHQLRSLSGEFADWGIFRAIPHEVACQQLLQMSL